MALDPFLLAGLVASKAYRRRKDRDEAEKALLAEQAKQKAEQAFELQKIDQKAFSEAKYEDQLAKAKNIREQTEYVRWQNPDNANDFLVRPQLAGVAPPKIPGTDREYDAVAIRVGSSGAWSDIRKYNGSGAMAGEPLYSHRGRVDSLKNLEQQFGLYVNDVSLNQVGTFDDKGVGQPWSIEEARVALGAEEKEEILVADKVYPMSQEPEAQKAAFDSGVQARIRTRVVTSDGKTLDVSESRPLGEPRMRKSRKVTISIPPQSKGGRTEQIRMVEEKDVDRILFDRGLRRDQVGLATYEIGEGPGGIEQSQLVNSSDPKDIDIERDLFSGEIMGEWYRDRTLQELNSLARNAGVDIKDLTLYKKTTKYRNGKEISVTRSTFQTGTPVKRHAAEYITEDVETGEPSTEMLVGYSEKSLKDKYGKLPGFNYLGVAEFDMSTGEMVGVPEERMAEDIAVFFPDLKDPILLSQMDADERARLRGGEGYAVPAQVNQDTGEIQLTGSISEAPGSSLAREMNMPYKLNGQFLGAPTSLGPADTIIQMHGKLTPQTVDAINASPDREEYIRQAVGVIGTNVRSIFAQQLGQINETRLARGMDIQQNTMRQVAGYLRRNGLNAFFQIEGMEDAIRSLDIVKHTETKSKLVEELQKTIPQGAQPIVMESASDPSVMDEENDIGSFAERGVDSTFITTHIPANHVPFMQSAFLPKILKLNGNNMAQAEYAIGDMLIHETDALSGDLIVQQNGSLKPAKNQPIIGYFKTLDSIKVTGGGGLSYLDEFIRYVNGDPTLALGSQKYQAFADGLIKATPNVRDAVEAVEIFMFDTPNNFDEVTYTPPSLMAAAKRAGLGPFSSSQTEKKFQASLGVIDSADRAINISNKILSTYVDPEGNLRPSSAVGEFLLSLDGMEYIGREVISRMTNALGSDGAVQTITNEYMSTVDRLKIGLGLQTTGSVGDGVTGNTGREEITKIVQEIAADVTRAKTAEERALAARGFHIVTLAYELSATIQGGTGGRTISDQDVALILRALRQKPLATPQQQMAVIIEAREMARELRMVAEIETSGDLPRLAAYYVVKNLSAQANGKYHQNISPEMVAARFGGVTQVDMFDDQVILDSVNLRRRAQNLEPYPSFAAIPQAEKDQFMADIQ